VEQIKNYNKADVSQKKLLQD